jgi:short-subunit dehydrogenase
MAADKVARIGVRALLAGRRVVVAGFVNSAMAFSTRFSPRGLTTKLAAALMKKAR